MGLKKYVAKRSVYTIVLLFLIVVFNFFLFQVFPFTALCPKGVTYITCVENLYLPEAPPNHGGTGTGVGLYYQQIRNGILRSYGFNQSWPIRFVDYIRNMFTGNFGFHIGVGLQGPVLVTIQQRAPYTMLLLGASTIAAFIIGIGLGVIAAAKRGKLVDISSLSVLLFLNSLPSFFLAAILLLMQIKVTGTAYVNLGTSSLLLTGWTFYASVLKATFLPFVSLTLLGIGGVFLTQRAVMIDSVQEDYIQMARAKGLPERTVLFKHAFRNAVLPIVTAFAVSIGFLLSGAIITETVFSYPGLGLALFTAVQAYDFPMEQALFFIISTMVLICVFIADVTYGFLDPRVSTG
ncbi:MAG: ABC transporter permease [Nitrososphaerales archaeon]|jgi:peptide/nickel transport system permease protein